MADKLLTTLTVIVTLTCLLSLVTADDALNNEKSGQGTSNCEDKTSDGNITRAKNCTTGRGLPGCCVYRVRCDYNSSNIDLSLYAPPGYKGSCSDKLFCCPVQYVMPIPVETDRTADSQDEVDNWKEDFD